MGAGRGGLSSNIHTSSRALRAPDPIRVPRVPIESPRYAPFWRNTVIGAPRGPILPHCGCWKIVEGECVLESVHLQRVEGTPCQSGGCSHTEGSESLRSGSCIIESEVTACGGPATGAEQPSCRSAARSSSQLLPLRRPRP